MSIVSGDFNTPTTRSSSIDSEEFTTPFTIMENNVDDDNIPDVPETVNDPTAPMTLEDLAQLMANGFANVNARIDSLNRSTEIDKEITDRRIDNLILANNQLNDDIKVIQVRQLMTDGYVHLTDNKVEEIKNINYQSNQDEALIEHDDITITGKVMFINEYTEGLLIALTIADKDAVVANITTKNLLTNVHATDIKLNDIIKITKFMAERAKTLDELGLSNEMFGPDFNPEMYLSQETNTDDDDVREYKLIRILSFKQIFRSAEEAIKVIGQSVKNLTRDFTALKSSVKQIMDDKTDTTINALDKDRRSSVQTRVSLVEENKDKGFKAKRTTMLNGLIQNQMVNGEVVSNKDTPKDDDSEEEDNPYKVLQVLREKKHQSLIGTKTRTGFSNSLDVATIEQITSKIFEEHSKFKGEVSKTNIPPGLIQMISKALNEDKIYYPKSTNKITIADIKFFYDAWMFGDKTTSVGNSGIPNNTLVIKHPLSQDSINQMKTFFPITLTISNPKNLNSIVAFIRHLQTMKDVEVSVIQVVSDEALRALIAKNESRKDPKGKVILEKCGIITSKTHFHTFMSTGINSNPITNAANSLTFDDILDMWIYSIQITSKDSFANILYQALQYNRSQEPFREGLYLDSVLYYKEIYERLNKHLYDFAALFKVLMTYVDPNFVPPTVVQVPSIQTDNINPNAKVVLLDLLSVFIKSFTIPNYLIRVYQDMDDQFKADIRSYNKDIIDVLEEFTKKAHEHLQVSEKALLMTRTLANASDSATQFFATHRGSNTSKIATAPTANQVTRPPYVKPSTNAIAPAASQKITSYFPSNKQSLRYMHNPMSHAPISGSRHEAEYDSEGWYGPDPLVISTAQDYIMNTTPSVYDVNDPFHSQNYSQTPSDIARTVDPNHLAYVMHLSNIKPFTAFEKNKAQNKGPCFNYFSEKGCHLKDCQFSHLPQDMVSYYQTKIKDVQNKMSPQKLSVLQQSQEIDHLSISNSLNVDGRERGEEGQGDVAVNEIDTGQQQQQLPTDTQHQAADHADLYKFFDKLSNDQQAQILNHVKHDLERRAGSTMYQQGFVAGRPV